MIIVKQPGQFHDIILLIWQDMEASVSAEYISIYISWKYEIMDTRKWSQTEIDKVICQVMGTTENRIALS